MSRQFEVGDRVQFASKGDFERHSSSTDPALYDTGEVVEVFGNNHVRIKWDSDGETTVPDPDCIRLIEDAPNKHFHHDVIIQWAKGHPVQYRNVLMRYWRDVEGTPEWKLDTEYRVKPKKVKKTGWVNIYPPTERMKAVGGVAYSGWAYETKEDADNQAQSNRITCVEIEWEEEA